MSSNYKILSEKIYSILEPETIKLISDFTIIWNIFEDRCCDTNFESNRDVVIDKINLKCTETHKPIFIKLYNDLKKYNSRYKEDMYKFYNVRTKNISRSKFEEFYETEKYEDSLKMLFIFSYRVRCNLFHGLKKHKTLNEQKELFELVNEFLSFVLISFFEYDIVGGKFE